MDDVITLSQRIAPTLLRLTMGAITLRIGALKFVDPAPVVGLIEASLPFLAHDVVAYGLGAIEIVVAALMLANIATHWVGLALLGLFAGTLGVFVLASELVFASAGAPRLTLTGQFLLKDLVLFAAALTIVANAAGAPVPVRVPARVGIRVPTRVRSN